MVIAKEGKAKNMRSIFLLSIILILFVSGCIEKQVAREGITQENLGSILEQAFVAFDSADITTLIYDGYRGDGVNTPTFVGTTYIKKPDRMRQEDAGSIFIGKGTTNYQFDKTGKENFKIVCDEPGQALTKAAVKDYLVQVTQKYDLIDLALDEVNGIPAYRFNAVIPERDELNAGKIGHRLWIDRETLLPLKDVAFWDTGEIAYTTEFRNYRINQEIDESMFVAPEGKYTEMPC